ncbi:uncharacterized protein LOC128995686 [Macrosteles quadrilineatus]|uniref:uncharacterized protein LOC128995686 n=1 Tax=Macrosteles quadrilineatus TaxID=74068 RepID=UPI0023E208B8|nr:uncharacterized protein LOC128995686 [Macrosteles quadrilineatus]
MADTDKLVSFDVESLFTNVPVSETLKIIETRLTNDDTLANRTKLPVNVIMELLELCTQCNYFQLEGKLYRQDEGMAMGSPLSPIFANIFMEEFEQKALASARLKPRIWWRYVDDTFVVFPHGDDKLNEFLEHLNSVSSSIKLTMEVESQNKLPFLDVCVEKHLNSLRTSVYRKKTHTGQYLNFQSNQQISVKEGVAYSLFDRAKSICSNQDELKDEIKKVEQDLFPSSPPLAAADSRDSYLPRLSSLVNEASAATKTHVLLQKSTSRQPQHPPEGKIILASQFLPYNPYKGADSKCFQSRLNKQKHRCERTSQGAAVLPSVTETRQRRKSAMHL